jgi:hypothetical protein
MIGVDYGVLNQKGSPSWFSDIYANIPTAGYKGRMFISIDTYAFYRDTGTGWDLIGGPGTGTITGSGASGQVSYFNGSSTLAGSNNLFWDNTNSRLGIGTITPGQSLDIHGTANTLIQLNNTTTGNSNISFQNQDVAKWRVGNVYNAGANSFDIQNASLSTNAISIQSSSNDITLTGNVNNGVKVITTGAIVSNSILSVKNTGSVTGTNGYSSFSGNLANNGFTFAPNNTNYLRFITPTSANYDYTFPSATGTLALTSDLGSYVTLGTTQTITANKTFSEFGFFDKGVLLKENIYPSSSGYNGIGAISGGFYFSLGQTSVQTLLFSTTTPYQYTFPSATGTIALTSNLSSYLPLAGGTLTGNLTINPTNTGVVGLDVASNTTRFRSDNLEGFKRQLEITMGSGTLVQLTAKGYLANYGTDLAFYTATTGGTNASPGIYITGTNNRVGIKTGTPSYDLDVAGTFGVSGAGIFGGNLTIGLPTADPILILNGDNSGGNSYVNFNADNGGTKAQIQGTKFAGTGGQLIFKTLQSSVMTTAMTINQVGNIGIAVAAATDTRLLVKAVDTTGSNYALILNNSSNANLFFVRNDGFILTGTGAGSPYNLPTTGRSAVIESNGGLGYLVSTRESKGNIESIKNIDFIYQLNPVLFNYRKKDNNLNFTDELYDNINYGFIADEVEKINKELVFYNKDNTLAGVEYNSIIAILTKAIQELNEKLERNNIN